MKAQELLFQLQDKGYRDFQSKLIPTIPVETIIGVRIPAIRKLAKEYGKDPESVEFLKQLPHTYYDENILHALLVAEIKDYEVCVKEVERFLPYVDNWAVCDIYSPKVFRKNKDKLITYYEAYREKNKDKVRAYKKAWLERKKLERIAKI